MQKKNIKIDIVSKHYKETNRTDDVCAICQETLENDDEVSTLDCDHIFHTYCIKEWGCYKPECPICKHSIKNMSED